jgi:hypothetical protein
MLDALSAQRMASRADLGLSAYLVKKYTEAKVIKLATKGGTPLVRPHTDNTGRTQRGRPEHLLALGPVGVARLSAARRAGRI